MLEKLNKYLIILLVFILILDPSDLIFRLKIPVFLLVFFVWLVDKIVNSKPLHVKRELNFTVFILLAIPIISIISGVCQGSITNWDFAIGIVKSFSILVLLFITFDLDFNLMKYVSRISLIIILLTIPLYFIFLINPDLFRPVSTFLVDDKQVVLFALREYFGLPIVMIFYKTCPLLIFPLCFYLDRYFKDSKGTDLIIVILCLITLFLSGTRANILIEFMSLIYFFINNLVRRKRYTSLFFTGIAAVCLVIFSVISLTGTTGSDESSDIKSGHFESMMEQISKPGVIIWGQGIGSEYFSRGVGTKIAQSELTYFELVRVFGLPLTLLFMFFLLYPIIYLFNNSQINENKDIFVAYLGYLFIAGTNPLLLSSTGMLVIVAMYSVITNKKLNESK